MRRKKMSRAVIVAANLVTAAARSRHAFHNRQRALLVSLLCLYSSTVTAQISIGTAFTYQGRLNQGGGPASGAFDMTFRLFNALSGGSQVGSDEALINVPVTNGLFTVEIDFDAAAFSTNQALWLEVVVEGVPLAPRQRLANAPYSLATRGLSVSGAGDIGIGTLVPQAQLHVARTQPDNLNLMELSFVGGDVGSLGEDAALLRITSNSGFRPFVSVKEGNFLIDAAGTLRSSGSAYFTNGRVGVGTASPTALLSAHRNSALPAFDLDTPDGSYSYMVIRSAGVARGLLGFGLSGNIFSDLLNESIAFRSERALQLGSGATSDLTIAENGNIGIGTTAPAAKLHLAGTAGVDGIRFPDGSLQTTAATGGSGSGGGISGLTEYGASGPFSVPANTTHILVEMWGAGGGGSSDPNGFGGGSGAYVRTVLATIPGETLTIEVGLGGQIGIAGGSTRVIRQPSTVLATAGGGGAGTTGPGAGGIASAPTGVRRNGFADGAPPPFVGRIDTNAFGEPARGFGGYDGAGGPGYVIIQW